MGQSPCIVMSSGPTRRVDANSSSLDLLPGSPLWFFYRLRFGDGTHYSASSHFTVLRFEKLHQSGHVLIADGQLGHAHLLVFLKQGSGNGVLFGQHSLRFADVANEPVMIASQSHSE